MLLSMLPGLRELRTPLIVGAFWLLNFWLIVGDDVPRSGDEAEARPVRLLYDAGDRIGGPAEIVALGFLAFLIGSLLTVDFRAVRLQRLVLRLLPSRRDLLATEASYLRKVVFAAEQANDTRDQQPGDRAVFGELTLDLLSDLRPRYPRSMSVRALHRLRRSEVPALRYRLLAVRPDLHNEYLRLASEASLRVNLGLPIAVFGVLVAWGGGGWGALACGCSLVAAGTLFVRGLLLAAEGESVVMRALVDGLITNEDQDFNRCVLEYDRKVAERKAAAMEAGGGEVGGP